LHINITLANKLFDYMGAGLPIIGSDGPPMRRVLEETGAGVVVPPQNAEALSAAMVELINDPMRRAELGERGRAAVGDGAYAWKRDQARFLAAMELGAK
jgi:glycosyltransferase involved in cell wall biosynthesis